MRGWLTLTGLLIVLGVVGLLVRKQTSAVRMPVPVEQVPAEVATGMNTPTSGSAPQSSQQMQQHYKQAIEGAMQARPMPDDK